MKSARKKLACFVFALTLVLAGSQLSAQPVPVRHFEGVTFGFLVLRNLNGEILAHGELKQVVKPDSPVVMADLSFRFEDGSRYREITKFTQNGTFRLVSDQVIQKGPAFKEESESWIDAKTGKVTVRTTEKGKEKTTNKHLEIPNDVANGLLFTITKNLDPSVSETSLSMVAASDKPRLVTLQIRPGPEKDAHFGAKEFKAQHYIIHVKVPGAAGVVAPIMGKQPPDIHLWVLKSDAPTFLEFEGPLSQNGPVWRIELGAPEPAQKTAQK